MKIPTLLLLLFAAPGWSAAESTFESRRAALVAEVGQEVRETAYYTGIGRLDSAVMAAIAAVPRHEFVPAQLREHAYENTALPIGADQTISQPFIVALMTHLARLDEDSIVLEVGTGSGYQAAVLASIVRHVYTIEIVESLGRRAEATLDRLGYGNVTVRIGDGYAGWPEAGPFDAIVVTAAPDEVPEPLLAQLRPGGRLVVPVGGQHEAQSLEVIEKREDGGVETTEVLPVMFVPLTRGGPR
jgi:protein-L-isoaspartate(D-aspartate) O-methyltransferase